MKSTRPELPELPMQPRRFSSSPLGSSQSALANRSSTILASTNRGYLYPYLDATFLGDACRHGVLFFSPMSSGQAHSEVESGNIFLDFARSIDIPPANYGKTCSRKYGTCEQIPGSGSILWRGRKSIGSRHSRAAVLVRVLANLITCSGVNTPRASGEHLPVLAIVCLTQISFDWLLCKA